MRSPYFAAFVGSLAVLYSAAPASSGDAAAVYKQSVQPVLAKNCYACHNMQLKTANLDLSSLKDADAALKQNTVWEDVKDRLAKGTMPPKGLPRPAASEITDVTAWIDSLLNRPENRKTADPGRVTARRLNKYEYNATVRDLLGVRFRPADDFPSDDSGYGFDNIGDVLSLSPVLMEKYLAAAEKIVSRAIASGPLPKPTLDRYKSDSGGRGLRGALEARHDFPRDAAYDIRIGIGGRREMAYEKWQVGLMVDDKLVKTFDLNAHPDEPRSFDVRIPLTNGDHRLRGMFTLRADNETGFFASREKTFIIDYIEIRGPFPTDPPMVPASYSKVFVCGHPAGQHKPECARQIVSTLARRAFRRPVTPAEVDNLLKFVSLAQQQGESFERGIALATEAMLVSPYFLFRIERDPDPANPAAAHAINDFELATRLSYFLWSSMPDEELLRCAEQGTLRKREVLEAQVRRMLKDRRSNSLVENFAGQWLELRNLDSVRPDGKKFPGFNSSLREAMRTETEMFVRNVIQQDASILDFIDGKYSFLNDRLAKHYGIPGVTGSEFRRVELDGQQRSGILTQASILAITSYPTRTSPVLRGKWLLENILGTPPPPPPPDAGVLDEKKIDQGATVRQQFEQHRANPSCAVCHSQLDPLGFALDHYDPTGAWRDREGSHPVDASGVLPDGKQFNGAAELKQILLGQKDQFAHCLTEKLLTYALGRGLERYDRPAIQQISSNLMSENYRFSALVMGIVESMPFQMRRGDGGKR